MKTIPKNNKFAYFLPVSFLSINKISKNDTYKNNIWLVYKFISTYNIVKINT